jgi:peptidoglycan/LPS O-acetylase OafA/YrhL
MASSGASPSTIPSLDGWRAISILIVFMGHAGLGHIVPGGLGVTIFFFLSGFLITTLLLSEYQATETINVKFFYLRRFFRLMPPVTITLAIAYGLTAAGVFRGGATFTGFASQLLYFSNYYLLFYDTGNSTPDGTGIFWSLAVEEHFYFIFPWLLIVLLRFLSPARAAWTLLFLALTILLWRITLTLGVSDASDRIYYASDTRFDSLLYGCLLACWRKEPGTIQRFFPARLTTPWIGICLLMLLSTLLYRNPWFRDTFRYTIQGLLLVPLFYYSTMPKSAPIFDILNNKVIRQLGIYSYSIYLCHFVLIQNLDQLSSHPIVNPIAAGCIALLYAYLMDRFVDRYFLRFRKAYR